MAKYDRVARSLDTVYIWSYFVQLAALVSAGVGLIAWARGLGEAWPRWLLAAAAIVITACIASRWYIKSWFRRRWPIE